MSVRFMRYKALANLPLSAHATPTTATKTRTTDVLVRRLAFPSPNACRTRTEPPRRLRRLLVCIVNDDTSMHQQLQHHFVIIVVVVAESYHQLREEYE